MDTREYQDYLVAEIRKARNLPERMKCLFILTLLIPVS